MSMNAFPNQPALRREEQYTEDGCIYEALGCIWYACTPECGLRGQVEFCCMRKTYCLEPCLCSNAKPRIVGLADPDQAPDEICKIGFYCCDYAIIVPRILLGCGFQHTCIRVAGSLPLHKDYMDHPRFALYCVSCYPDCNIADRTPKCRAFDNLHFNGIPPGATPMRMDRGDEGFTPTTKVVYEPVAMVVATEMV